MKRYACALLLCIAPTACGRDIDQYTSGNNGGKSTNNNGETPADSDDDDDTSGASSTEYNGVPRLRGVNIAGGEFGTRPGTQNKDYTYPTKSEVDYFFGKGMNVFRLPFLWERIQGSLNGSVDLSPIDSIVAYATETKGGYVLLDMHNYARWNSKVVGSSDLPTAAFADVWGKIANHYKDNDHVIFGLMNEPHDMDINVWLGAANAALAAIRDAGATNLATVPGIAWTGAHSWLSANAAVMESVNDPGDNFVFEMHQYFDSDSSGTHDSCISETIGAERLEDATGWLRDNGFKALLGEFGATQDATCLAALDGTLAYMEEHDAQWFGWTYWAAGAWWGDYMFSVEPSSGTDKPQMAKLAAYLD